MGKSFWAAFLILTAALITVNISVKKQQKINAPIEQTIENLKITVTSPPLYRQESLELRTKEKLKEKAEAVYFYTSSYGKSDYLIHYCEYKYEVNLQKAADSIVSKFKDKNFEYYTKENEIDGAEGILIEGTFDNDGMMLAIKEQVIKKKTSFWQVLVIYPYSEKNNKAAERFINSISIGGSEK